MHIVPTVKRRGPEGAEATLTLTIRRTIIEVPREGRREIILEAISIYSDQPQIFYYLFFYADLSHKKILLHLYLYITPSIVQCQY